MNKRKLAFVTVVIAGLLLTLFAGCKVKEVPVSGVVKLRSQYKQVDDAEMKAMVKKHNFYEKRFNKFRSFANKFELKAVGGDKIVIDHATGLAWHQSGSEAPLTYQGAKQWLEDLNRNGYGGYRKWRLPTLEEAASLLEGNRVENRYIDPMFDRRVFSMRTGDIFNEFRSWGVSFHYGAIFKVGAIEPDFVRPVTVYSGGN